MKSKKVYLLARFALLAAVLMLAGCAGMAKKDEDASVIKQKAVQRWDYLIAHQAEKAWDYLAPGYRKTITREQYGHNMNGRGTHWSKVRYVSQECSADTCTVRLTVDYSINLGGLSGNTKSMAPLVETWIKSDGAWYYLPQMSDSKLGGKAEP